MLNSYAHIFDILIRLCQIVDHPYLVLFGNSSIKLNESNQFTNSLMNNNNICDDSVDDPRFAKCGHVFCFSCITEYLQVENADTTALCPTYQTPLSLNWI